MLIVECCKISKFLQFDMIQKPFNTIYLRYVISFTITIRKCARFFSGKGWLLASLTKINLPFGLHKGFNFLVNSNEKDTKKLKHNKTSYGLLNYPFIIISKLLLLPINYIFKKIFTSLSRNVGDTYGKLMSNLLRGIVMTLASIYNLPALAVVIVLSLFSGLISTILGYIIGGVIGLVTWTFDLLFPNPITKKFVTRPDDPAVINFKFNNSYLSLIKYLITNFVIILKIISIPIMVPLKLLYRWYNSQDEKVNTSLPNFTTSTAEARKFRNFVSPRIPLANQDDRTHNCSLANQKRNYPSPQ